MYGNATLTSGVSARSGHEDSALTAAEHCEPVVVFLIVEL